MLTKARRQKPLLTPAHIKKRLAWAKAHADWTVDDWKAVVFSDKSKFNLVGSDGRQWCWGEPGQEPDPQYVTAWGCITSSGLGRLVRIEGNMSAQLYIEILNDNLLGTFKDLGIKKKDVYFQQDNNLRHTARLTQDWLHTKKVDVLSWLPSSPDMNIIEHVWNYLDRRVRTGDPLHRNPAELWAALLEEWDGIKVIMLRSCLRVCPGEYRLCWQQRANALSIRCFSTLVDECRAT